MLKLYNDLKNNKNALMVLAEVSLKSSVSETRLGWLWWVLDPLIMMAIYYFMVRVVFERGGENYHLFVLSGIVVWKCFSSIVNLSTRSIASNKSLIRQLPIPLPVFILIPSMVQLLFALIGITIVMLWSYEAIGYNTLGIFPLFLLLGLFGFGIGLFTAVSQVLFNDTATFVRYVIRAGFFLSPILYPASRVLDAPAAPEIVKLIYSLNPMAWLIPAFRGVLLDGVMFDWYGYFVVFLLSIILIQVGLFWLRSQTPLIVKTL